MLTFLEEPDQVELRSRRAQDEAFCACMLRAVNAGYESPPMIGVDTRPGTTRPVVMVR